jgi:NADH-quinone oxidoreductase subunit H
MKLGMYLFAEYINMFISSAVLATLFFGGYNFPWMDQVAQAVPSGLFALICVTVLMIKIIGFILFFMFIRWTLPRFRYDQLLNLGWKGLIPLALINLVITGAVILWFFN